MTTISNEVYSWTILIYGSDSIEYHAYKVWEHKNFVRLTIHQVKKSKRTRKMFITIEEAEET